MEKKQVTINELYNTLYETIKDVREGRLDTAKAKVINETAQVMVNAAKAEADFLKMTKQNESHFYNPDGYYKELDNTLDEIERRNKEPYQLGN